ncbi:hypothetical protein SBV1_1070016 [Verrucomicrobia bacterium]|nr:hypothetical protein SBV1_1070016 [Verrucomicrobiota bacterium]
MAKRGFCFYCGFVAQHYLRELPGTLLTMPTLRAFPFEVKRGIRVVDAMPPTGVRPTSTVGAALDLVAASDPVRFGRVGMHIRTVAVFAGLVSSVYHPAFKICCVNLRCLGSPGDTPSPIEFLASIIVHDATIGYLEGQGVLRTGTNYDRFDRLCCEEARRFLKRLGMARTPWDPERLWRPSLRVALTFGLQDMKQGSGRES